MCGADCWPVSESGTENISASDSSSESPRFFVAGKKTEPTSPVQFKILKSLNGFSLLPNSFFICLIGNWFLTLSYGLRRQCCLFTNAAFYKCSVANVESEGNDQWQP